MKALPQMRSEASKMHALIIGAPGVGKSTLIRRVLAELNRPVFGFLTKKEDALAVLKALIESKNTIPQMRDVASLKLVSYKLDTDASKDEIMVLLQPMLEKEKGFEIAHELMAMLYIRENDIESAKAQYQKIATSADVSETIKSRALDMVNLLNEQ